MRGGDIISSIGQIPIRDHDLLTGLADNDHPQYVLHTQLASVVKTIDEIVNNSIVLQNDDELFLPMVANENAIIQLLVKAKSPTLTTLRVAFAIPAGAIIWWIPYQTSTAFSNGADMTVATQFTVLAATSKYYLMILYYIGGANAGNLQFQWAQWVATAENTTVEKSSYLTKRTL